MTPNPSLEPTHYGRQRNPSLRCGAQLLSSGLRRLSRIAAKIERYAIRSRILDYAPPWT